MLINHPVKIEDHINHLLDIYEDNITIEKKERVYTKLDNIIKICTFVGFKLSLLLRQKN
jgi:hypothetical protein